MDSKKDKARLPFINRVNEISCVICCAAHGNLVRKFFEKSFYGPDGELLIPQGLHYVHEECYHEFETAEENFDLD